MKTLARRQPQVELIRRSIIDEPETVAARVALVRRSGRLIDMTKPKQLPDGRAHVVVTLLPLALNRRNDPARRRTVAVVAAAAGTVVLAAAAYALYAAAQLVEAVAAHTEWLVGGLVIAGAVVFLRPNHRAACPGLHCGGCRSGRS